MPRPVENQTMNSTDPRTDSTLTLTGTELTLPPESHLSIPILLKSPCTSFWLKNNLRSLSRHDALDVCRDAEILAAVAQARLREVMGR